MTAGYTWEEIRAQLVRPAICKLGNAERNDHPTRALGRAKRIVAEVERRSSVVEAVVSANLQRAERLRQSILDRAFTGTLAGVDIG
jgi:hypothetical protein